MSWTRFFVLLAFVGLTKLSAQPAYTPEAGSAERQAICDAARAFVMAKYATAALPQPLVFKIQHLRVQNGYCNFEAIPLFKDGNFISTKYMPDIAFNFCLKKADHWNVMIDLSRTDVPDEAERQTIKRNFPSDFPVSLLSPTWRELLNRSH